MSVLTAEIYWPANLPPEAAVEAEKTLSAAGVATTCRLRAVRRGVESYALVVLATPAAHTFLRAVFERLGSEAFEALRGCVRRLLGDGRPGQPAPAAVVFTSAATGADFVFTADLPEEAFRQAIVLDPGAEPGRWVWQPQQRGWHRFEARQDP